MFLHVSVILFTVGGKGGSTSRGSAYEASASREGGGGVFWSDPPRTRKAGGKHPTGMLSCFR